ncbi:MAG: prephenate dehydratase domain-containing protein [Candidatus Dojkabacteria bacterium]|nr:prephenate dehydratase domain-containing protein [Candidatus Dojkabacteria bacterium]
MLGIFGIQGGLGSFNEEALLYYIKRNGICDYKVNYLYTSENVLKALEKGDIDYGLFAVWNSVGGFVSESIYAMANYDFSIVAEFSIPIQHHLMKRKDIETDEIYRILAHPQVFRQCKNTLARKYPSLLQESGTGDLIDTAQSAKALVENEIESTTFILGPKRLSSLYDLDIVDKNLQDEKANKTSFLLVSRKR